METDVLHVVLAQLGVQGAEGADACFGLLGRSRNFALAGDLLLTPLARSYERHTLIKRADTPEAQRTRIEFGRFTANNALMGAVALVLRRQGRLG